MRNLLSVVILVILILLLCHQPVSAGSPSKALELRKKVEELRRIKAIEAESDFRRHASSFREGGYAEVMEVVVASTREEARSRMFDILKGGKPAEGEKVFLYLLGSNGETYRIRIWSADKDRGRAILVAEEEAP